MDILNFKMNNNCSDIRETFNRFRKALNEVEEEDKVQNGVPYSQQDELYQSSTQVTKEQFGAVFKNKNECMFYFKDDGNVILTGNIPSLNDAQFQYKYKSENGNGCFIWSVGQMILSDENIRTLSKIWGVYKNWKKELDAAEDIKPTNLRNEE